MAVKRVNAKAPRRRPEIQGATAKVLSVCHICWVPVDAEDKGVSRVVSRAGSFYVHNACAIAAAKGER